MNFYTWDSSDKQFNGNWPGQAITATKVINGVKFYYHTYNITGKNYYMNFVFNQGSSAGQTVDVTNVTTTSFFEVTTQTSKYEVADVTDIYLPYLDGGDAYDVNGDNEVNIADVNAVINIILSGGAGTKGDVNNDGEINIADINALIDYILAH